MVNYPNNRCNPALADARAVTKPVFSWILQVVGCDLSAHGQIGAGLCAGNPSEVMIPGRRGAKGGNSKGWRPKTFLFGG